MKQVLGDTERCNDVTASRRCIFFKFWIQK